MKKLIAILTIAIVLVGAVFADAAETHSITIKAEVLERLPAFQLKLDDATTNSSAALFEDGNDYGDNQEVDYATGVAGTTWDLSKNNKSLEVYAYLANDAKVTKVFTLYMFASEFSSATVDSTLAPSTATVVKATGADDTLATVGSAANLTEGDKTTYSIPATAKGQKITVTFSDDVTCVPGNLAKFTVDYTANSEMKIADDYEATITMVVYTT